MQEKKKGCFYIGGRCYSTDTAAILCSYTGIFESVTLYVTPKRAFFVVEESETFGDTVRVLSETEARQLMDEHAAGIDTNTYNEIFGEPEQG